MAPSMATPTIEGAIDGNTTIEGTTIEGTTIERLQWSIEGAIDGNTTRVAMVGSDT